jgi:hypothetical protein
METLVRRKSDLSELAVLHEFAVLSPIPVFFSAKESENLFSPGGRTMLKHVVK